MKYVVLFFALMTGWAAARAQSTDVFQPVIQHQLDAMSHDDNAAAYGDAAPSIQQTFPSPDTFMAMVRNGYPMVYRNQGYEFKEAGTDPSGRLYQRLQIRALDGTLYDAIYFMQQQPDGSWKISGCVLAKSKGGEA